MHVLVIHGPNLNLLGTREPEVYGSSTLDDINESLKKIAEQASVQLSAFQSNAEHEIVSKIQQARDSVQAIIINPAAFTHTSVALRDALLSVDIPFYEVHISNVYRRESFRQQSYLSDVAQGVITGFGVFGYECALNTILKLHAEQ